MDRADGNRQSSPKVEGPRREELIWFEADEEIRAIRRRAQEQRAAATAAEEAAIREIRQRKQAVAPEAEEKLRAIRLERRVENGVAEQAAQALTPSVTRIQWLQQPLLALTFGFDGSCFSMCQDASVLVAKLRVWKEFDENVKAFVDSEDVNHEVLYSPIELDAWNIDCIHSSRQAVNFNMNTLLQRILVRFFRSRAYELDSNPETYDDINQAGFSVPRRYVPDCVVKMDQRDIIVIEFKRPTIIRQSSGEEPPVLQEAERDCLKNSLQQILKYMGSKEVGYGILTSCDVTYFLHAETSKDIEISEGICWNINVSERQGLVAALAYFIDAANRDSKKHKFEFADNMSRASDFSSESEDSMDHDNKDPSEIPPKLKKVVERDRVVTRSQGAADSQGNILKRFHLVPFKKGWSGNVYLGKFEDQSIVVKVAKSNTDQADALQNEIRAYEVLKECWGKYVPKLVSSGTCDCRGGQIVYLATEYINGCELTHVEKGLS